MADKSHATLTSNQKVILRRRGLDPAGYEFVKETYAVLYVRRLLDGKIVPINKCN